MKNVKRLLVATAALISATSMATLVQPGMPASEDAPFRVTVAAGTGLIKPKEGFGINNLFGGLGFSQNVGYDFEYGLAVAGGWAAPESSRKDSEAHRIFAAESEKDKMSGFRLEAELMARFMPEIAEKFRIGGVLGIGWSNQFGGDALKPLVDATKFGDLSFRVGPAVSFGVSDMIGLYAGVNLTMTAIRWAKDESPLKEEIKKDSNLIGMEIPVGLWFGVGENVGLFLEANTKFRNFENFAKSWKEDVTLGVSFAI